MAEGTSSSHFGSEDFFSYDQDARIREATRRRTTLCRYFREGRCRFGPNCWYLHPDVNNSAEARASQRSERSFAGPSRQRSKIQTRTMKPDKKNYEPKYNLLNKSQFKNSENSSTPANWVNAPEFVPKKIRSYADTLKGNQPEASYEPSTWFETELCANYVNGNCSLEDQCSYVHGDVCDVCQRACLDPYNAQQRQMHKEFCEKEFVEDMELSFAIQRSRDKICGVCMDVIMEKEPMTERRFGILDKCNHVFCLSCIRKWRKVKSFEGSTQVETVVTRACPECRVQSDFITPSQYWVDSEEEKSKLIADYKVALSKKSCKYFKQGSGTCPFGGSCFYLHAKPDGTKVELPPPVRRRRQNQDGETDFMRRIFLWDYLEIRDDFLMQLELEDLIYSLSDTDDDISEDSENIFL